MKKKFKYLTIFFFLFFSNISNANDLKKNELIEKNLKVLKNLRGYEVKYQKIFNTGMCIGFYSIKTKFQNLTDIEVKWINNNISFIKDYTKIENQIVLKLGKKFTMMSEDLHLKMKKNNFSQSNIDMMVGSQIGWLTYKFLNKTDRDKLSLSCTS